MILLDTQVLVWCSLDPGRLGPHAAAAIERAWSAAELAVSAISCPACGASSRSG